MKAAFEKLEGHRVELKKNAHDTHIMKAERLIELQVPIEICDYVAETQEEKRLVLETAYYWNICYDLWLKYKPSTEKTEVQPLNIKTTKDDLKKEDQPQSQALMRIEQVPDRRKESRTLTNDDRRFLKEGKIGVDGLEDDEDGKN